jgi:alpha,alpha-trehalase
MLEKYNVENISLFGGGGEYPLQDGFGWTNGVAAALIHNFDRLYLLKK